MTAAPLESVPFSELLRQPAETTDRLTRTRAVRLRRRDAADLVLMSAERAEAEAEVIDVTSRLLAGVARRDPRLLREVLPNALPWVRFLPVADIDAMAAELVSVTEAAAAIGNTAAVSQLLVEWRRTAEIHADPDLHRALTTQTLDDFGAVPRPEDSERGSR
ncbi:hypothetical protein ACFFX1_15215 [Dactylosporangium sucinum]|uniref:Prevent-host-death family protein n=1 Tax=Dactylosporangium sucinum TaxID=1424081 RepID=A0A917UGW2_9ACTN|nr:hypothetical protein [Dactylosporangium sucinum]GGM88326.1 hypothetical protein GCM10007977_107940 [Dactylosporangium sucinum]